MIGVEFLLLAAAQGCSAAEPKTSAALRAAEADWVLALEQRDVRRLSCRLAEEFADTTWRGHTSDRKSTLDALPKRPSSSLHLTFTYVRVHGDIGLVRGVNTQTDDHNAPVGAVRFTDVFIYRDGRWQALAAQETPIKE